MSTLFLFLYMKIRDIFFGYLFFRFIFTFIYSGSRCHSFRNSPLIHILLRVKILTRKEKTFSKGKRLDFPGKQLKERTNMSNSNNNRINIPQAREAMDRFKMQAAQDEDVSSTS